MTAFPGVEDDMHKEWQKGFVTAPSVLIVEANSYNRALCATPHQQERMRARVS